MGISTHILDTTLGRPAADVAVTLERLDGGSWILVGQDTTNTDGRAKGLVREGAAIRAGSYRLTFAVASYFEKLTIQSFYPSITITFLVRDPSEHFHVPLLLNPHGYTTYRGS